MSGPGRIYIFITIHNHIHRVVKLTHLVVVMLLPIWRELRVRATVCVDLSDVVDAVHQVPAKHH